MNEIDREDELNLKGWIVTILCLTLISCCLIMSLTWYYNNRNKLIVENGYSQKQGYATSDTLLVKECQ